MSKGNWIYDYYTVILEADFVEEERRLFLKEQGQVELLPYNLRTTIYAMIEVRTKLYVIPCEWKILCHSKDGFYYIFKVRRKRRRKC